jgi:hypothetical protein
MLIRKKVQNINPYVKALDTTQDIYVAVSRAASHSDYLRKLGFTLPLVAGEHLLPPGSAGAAARRNSEGKTVVHRDQPLETHFRQKEWSWKEFRGRYETVQKTGIVEVPYTRYPRTQLKPYSVELETRTGADSKVLVVAGPFDAINDADALLNTVHMFVELFGECALTKKDLTLAPEPARRQLNWDILPPGRYPWEKVKPFVENIIAESAPATQAVVKARFEEIAAYTPDFVAIGKNGFSRYVVYGWDSPKLYLLESTEVDNATYVLKEDWQRVSAMSKAEVLDERAHHSRIIHRKAWFRQLCGLMLAHRVQKA